jgi:excisionase family DNA binding protein
MKPATDQADLLSVGQAAELLQMARSSIYNLVNTGQLPHLPKKTRRLYFSKKELLAWIASGEKSAS